jgi:integrase
MRIDDRGKRVKVWLDEDEADALRREMDAKAWRRGIAARLMIGAGLRSEEVTTVSPDAVRRTKDGDHWLLRVRGKNTKGGEKTVRDAWLPEDLERELYRYAQEREIGKSDPYIPVTPRTVQSWVTEAAEALAEDTGDDDWLHVSSHDLRRHWAHHHLVEERVPVRVMMAIGGWSSYSAIEPYLTTPSEGNIIDAMTSVQ